MTATPMSRDKSLDTAAPATPRAGTGPRPLIRMALPPMLTQFIRTEMTMVSFII